MRSIFKLSSPAINFLFQQLAGVDSKVIWVRDPTYSQQLYISTGYEKIWGRSCEQLYNHPKSWNETIACSDKEKTIQQAQSRLPEPTDSAALSLYSIYDTQGNIQLIKDTCFTILGTDNTPIAVAGISEVVNEREWEELKKTTRTNPPENNILHQLNQQLPLTRKEALIAKLTKQESICLHYLMLGHSSKQIARILTLSPRTVEGHIHNIKTKLNCRTRLELLSIINDKDTSSR